MYLNLKYIKRRNQLSTTRQACSATTCSEVCLEEVSVCVRCSRLPVPSISMKAAHLYADFNMTQRNRCACIPQLEQEEIRTHSKFCFVFFLWHHTCMSLCCLLAHGLPLHLTSHMGLQYDAAKMPPDKNDISVPDSLLIVSNYFLYVYIFSPGHQVSDEPVLVFHFLVHPQDRPWTVLSFSFCLVLRGPASQPHGTPHLLLFCL